jgi:uncharacterized protein
MEKSRNILAWLGQREEKEILDDVINHMEKSIECVEGMKNIIQSILEKNMEKKGKYISEVKEAEHKGDEIRKKVMTELSKGMLFPPDREDLILLNEGINDIADGAKGVARLLEFFEKTPSEDIETSLLSDSLLAVKAAKQLKLAIQALVENDTQKVLEECAHIETLEKEGDDKRRELLGELIKTNLATPYSILIYEIIDNVEKVIDSVKKSGDMVRMLAIVAK